MSNVKCQIKNNWKLVFIGYLILVIILAPRASAQSTMYNDSFKLRMGNLNSIAGESSGSGFNLNITSGETGVGLYSGTNYKIRAGFQYINSIIPFSFSISSLSIDFGSLSPTNPVTRTNILTIDNQSAYGYAVTASENHQLLVPALGTLIPDTTCDAGNCSETTGTAWSSTLTYGFGYRCDAVTATNYCNSGFSTSTFYKQFADASKSETAQSVMSGPTNTTDLSGLHISQQSTITYKTNISSTQAAGTYTNAITYIATPTY